MFFHFSFSGSPYFFEGWCPGSQAPIFNQSNFFATTPIIYLKGRSFTISCWVKQTKNLDRDEVIYGDRYHGRSHFLLYQRGQKIVFQRDIPNARPFKLTGLSKVSLNSWTHLVVTLHHVKGTLAMYMDGNIIGHTTFSPKEMLSVYDPSRRRYMIGLDWRYRSRQFNGLVMDLYVFGTALSPKEINRLRGSLLSLV